MQTKSRGLNHGKKTTIYLSKYNNIITYFEGISHLQTNQGIKKAKITPKYPRREQEFLNGNENKSPNYLYYKSTR